MKDIVPPAYTNIKGILHIKNKIVEAESPRMCNDVVALHLDLFKFVSSASIPEQFFWRTEGDLSYKYIACSTLKIGFTVIAE